MASRRARSQALDLGEQAGAVVGHVKADDRVDDDVDIEAVPWDTCRCGAQAPRQALGELGRRVRPQD